MLHLAPGELSSATLLRRAAIALLILTTAPAEAVEIRVATFNLALGLEAPGTAGHDAVRDVLARIEPDIVTLQEIRTDDLSGSPSSLDSLATTLGYPHIFVPGSTPLDGGNYNVFLSRFPFSSTADVAFPSGANEMTRRHAVVTVDVPGTPNDPTLAGLHLKCCLEADDPFRRAVELKRLVDHLAGFTGTDNLIVLGADVSFPSLTDRTYRIERCTDLEGWFPLSAHPGTGATLDIPVAAAPGSRQSSYRVIVTLTP